MVIVTGEKWTDDERESWTIQSKIEIPIDEPAEVKLENSLSSDDKSILISLSYLSLFPLKQSRFLMRV